MEGFQRRYPMSRKGVGEKDRIALNGSQAESEHETDHEKTSNHPDCRQLPEMLEIINVILCGRSNKVLPIGSDFTSDGVFKSASYAPSIGRM